MAKIAKISAQKFDDAIEYLYCHADPVKSHLSTLVDTLVLLDTGNVYHTVKNADGKPIVYIYDNATVYRE